MADKTVFLWSPTNGKMKFAADHAQALLKVMENVPEARRTWFEYNGQDNKGHVNKSIEADVVNDNGNKGDSKKGIGKKSEGDRKGDTSGK